MKTVVFPLVGLMILSFPACRERSSAGVSTDGKTRVSEPGANSVKNQMDSGKAETPGKDFDRKAYETRKQDFKAAMDLAMKAFQKSDIPGCMAALDEAESKFGNRAELHNLRASCFVETRDFEKAREFFEKADQMSPNNPSIAFNLAEMDFLTGRWKEAIDRFEVVAEKFATKQNGVRELAEFKMMLSHSQLGQSAEAEEILTNFRNGPQSPAYYYSEAAATLLKGDFAGFERWRSKAKDAFPDEKLLAPWNDTMIEIGFMKQ